MLKFFLHYDAIRNKQTNKWTKKPKNCSLPEEFHGSRNTFSNVSFWAPLEAWTPSFQKYDDVSSEKRNPQWVDGLIFFCCWICKIYVIFTNIKLVDQWALVPCIWFPSLIYLSCSLCTVACIGVFILCYRKLSLQVTNKQTQQHDYSIRLKSAPKQEGFLHILTEMGCHVLVLLTALKKFKLQATFTTTLIQSPVLWNLTASNHQLTN